MNIARRQVSAAVILDCAGIGDGLAAMPLKHAVEAELAAGRIRIVVNLAGVTRMEAPFVRGVAAARLAAQRAEGELIVTGLGHQTKEPFAKYAPKDLPVAPDEQAALRALLPSTATAGAQVVVIGTGPFLAKAFEGIHHFQDRAAFHYYSDAPSALAQLDAIGPTLIIAQPQLGLPVLRQLRQKWGEPRGSHPGAYCLAVGTPKEIAALRLLAAQERYDDYLEIPFTGEEEVLPYLDQAAFRKVLARKVASAIDGWYQQERERKAKFGRL